MITLTHGGTTLTLPDRLLWADEYQWSPVATEVRWGTTGAPQLHVGLRQAGRPITLDGRDSEAWIDRTLCDQLEAWAALPGTTFTLVLRAQARTVVFDHSQGAAFDATPLWKLLDGEHTGDVLYRPIFKFMEV